MSFHTSSQIVTCQNLLNKYNVPNEGRRLVAHRNSLMRFKVQHAVLDTVLFALGFFLYLLANLGSISVVKFIPFAVTTLCIWQVTIYAFGGYDYNKIFKISHNFKLLVASGIVAIGITTVFSYLYPHQFTTYTFHYITLLFLAIFYLVRLSFTKAVSARLPEKNILIYGASWAGIEVVKLLEEHKYLKTNIVGFIDDDEKKVQRRFEGIKVLGDHSKLLKIVEDYNIDAVVFAITKTRHDQVLYAKSALEKMDIDTLEMPDLYENISGRVPVMHVNNTWHDFYVSLKHRQPYLMYRVYNIFLASLFTLIFLPVIPLVALAIRLTSKGPIIYSQKRIGIKEKIFTLYKFRTMRIDAEKFGAVFAKENDPRLTPVGGFLRKTRLDEIPQLINVFRGEMNFVGPRPERPKFVKQFNKDIPFYRSRHQVAPGLTGWAQVMMGYANTADGTLKKLQYDLYYIKNRNIFLDLLILLKTVQVVLTRKGT